MFIIKSAKDKTITWPVTVETAADGGKISKFEFTGTFKLLDDDAKEALVAEAKANTDAAGETEQAVNAWKVVSVDAILNYMTDWKGVVDESKTPIDFNRDNLLAVARSAQGLSIIRAINTAIGEINTGARAKN
jgi:hypothetical protein